MRSLCIKASTRDERVSGVPYT